MPTLLAERASTSRLNNRFQRARAMLLLAAITWALMPVQYLQADIAKLQLDQPAPDFVLASSTGKNLRLSEYRGSVVMLNFWSSSCGPCHDQLEWLGAISSSELFSAVSFLSINIDKGAHAERHVLEHQPENVPVLFDTAREVIRTYDPNKLPMIVMLDQHGSVRFIHEGHRAADAADFEQELAALLAE